ncbi:hypothetical protein HNY73_008274 [Argiope bruennichi]|uniref:RNA-directed DNA polymerase n=1 Tax=Argiope bruennichi TaxID=94029 RepID=A0A8T0F8C9_ARGBR|nr:hypothetical protein HNY73_008274 [Argiope bruennichi]
MLNAVETRAQKKLLEIKKDGTQSVEQLDEELKETTLEKNEINEEGEILPVVKELTVQDLIKTSPKVFAEEQHKSKELKILIAEAQKKTSKENKYILENNMLCWETKDALFKTFFWPNCYNDVENFIKTCDSCQRVGKPRDKKKAPLKIVPVITEIFSKLNVDVCGALPESTSGNKYLITVVCIASKYPDAIPAPNLCSTTIVDALLQIFSCLGFPQELQSDQGTSFMSVLTTEFLDKFGIRVNLEKTEKVLPHALFALRTVIHDSTGFSPAELLHGRNLRTPMMLLYENLTEQSEEESEAKQKQKLWYDIKAEKPNFKEGDLVLVIAPSKPNKLSVNLIGPGKIVKQLSETNFVVHYPNSDKTQVYHANMQPELTESREKNENQEIELGQLIRKYSKTFSTVPGCTDLAEHDIELENERPICAKPYRLSLRQSEILKAEVEKMLTLKIIEPGESDLHLP